MGGLLTASAPGVGELASDWTLDPTIVGGLVLAAGAYLAGARHVRRWPAWRTVAFLGGLGAVAVALQSGLDTWAGRLLSVHMAQHLVLALVAPPLLALGAPLTLVLRAARGDTRAGLGRVLRSRVARVVGHPAFGLAAMAAVTLGTHLTPLYGLALRHESVHALEHALYLGAGLAFWVPLVGGEPGRDRLGPVGRLAYPLLGMPPMAVVGAVLEATSSHPLYSHYTAPARALGVSALSDQRLAGAIMWVGGTLVLVPVAIAAAWAALHAEERRMAARERYADRLGAAR